MVNDESDRDTLNLGDEDSVLYSRREKGYSFAGASESDIILDGDGGAQDFDPDDIRDLLGVDLDCLTSIM